MRDESETNSRKLTRRDFARRAALAAATAAISPKIASAARRGAIPEIASSAGRANADDAAAARQAEIDARVADVFRRYGDRLSAEQKTEVRRLVGELQKSLDKLREYPLGNGDQPATVLRVMPDLTEVRRAPRR
jgi:hypothetical protein